MALAERARLQQERLANQIRKVCGRPPLLTPSLGARFP